MSSRIAAAVESLEMRRLLSFSVSFPGGATLTQRPDVNASKLNGNQTEGNVYINPTNPRNVVAFAIDLAQINPEKCWYSFDGGLTYNQSIIPNPGGTSGNGDPAAVFDRQGNLYFSHLTTGLSGSIARSSDGGQTWNLTSIAAPAAGVDKNWIGAGPNPANLSQDIIYMAYRKGVGSDIQLRVVRSLDQGATWGPEIIINDDSIVGNDFATFGRPVVRPSDGRLYVIWDDETNMPAFSEIKMDYSDDGGLTWHTDQLIGTTPVTRGNVARWDIPAQPSRGVLAVPSLAIAQTGPFANRLYASYTISPLGRPNSDIQVGWTDNPTGQAGTWNFTVPHPVTTNSQFHPWIETDPMTGIPYVSWMDAKDSPGNNTVKKTGTFSINGGVSWLPPIILADAFTNGLVTSSNFLEYDTNNAFGGMAFDCWSDTSNSTGNNPNGTSAMDWYTDRVVLGGHVITVTGTPGADVYHVRMDASGTFLNIWENTAPVGVPTFVMLEDAVDGINFFLGAGDDVINVDRLDPSMPLVIRGEAGQDVIRLGSATGALQSPATIDGGTDHDQIHVIETGAGAAATIVPSAGADDVFVNTGGVGTADVIFNATQSLGILQIEGGGSGTITANGATVLTVERLDLAGGGAGRLDLANNTLIVDYTGATPVGAIVGFLTSGYAGGAWNGAGINSSVAAGMGNTGVGVAEATDLFTVFPAPFAGTTVDNTSVLVRYTLYGDADLNRSVNLDDFNRLASNFGASPRRWSQGDFTFDTLVNLDDFNRLASNFGLSVAPAATISPRTNIGRRGSGEVDRRDDEEVPTLEDLYRAVGDAA
jgi:hypothetical protein